MNGDKSSCLLTRFSSHTSALAYSQSSDTDFSVNVT